MSAAVTDESGKEHEILIHSKVIVVDDVFARIGSSNLNNRSEGLDTECDIAFEPRREEQRRVIAGFRNRLIAEHLGTVAQALERAIEEHGSLLAAVDSLGGGKRRLRPYRINWRDGNLNPLLGTGILDPRKPFWPLQRLFGAARLAYRRLSARLLRFVRSFASSEPSAAKQQYQAERQRQKEIYDAKSD